MTNEEFPNAGLRGIGYKRGAEDPPRFYMRALFLLLAVPVLAAAAPLPREIVPQAAVLEPQPEEGGRKVWHTRFFRIDSDMELQRNQLQRLAQVADTTAMAVKSYPLPLFAPPEGIRARISIHGDPADYVEAGGFHGSAGFYIARQSLVLVRGDFLSNPGDPSRALLPANYDEDILVHELVHLCMHRQNAGLPQWLVEGLAEYFACAHSGGGRFTFTDMDKSVRDHLRARLNPKDPKIPAIRVAEICAVDSRGWLRLVESLPQEERYQTYASALLLAHCYLHGGARRFETLDKFFRLSPRGRAAEVLLPQDAAEKTQEGIVRYWQPRGLSVAFRPSK